MKQIMLEECVKYFQARPVYGRVFREMREKYAGLGRFGGTIVLKNVTAEERQQLQGFLRRDFSSGRNVSIPFAWMEKARVSSKYVELSWKEILEAYFSEKLSRNQDIREQEQKEREDFFGEILSLYCSENPTLGKWFDRLLRDHAVDGYHYVIRLYHQDREALGSLLRRLERLVSHLPALDGRECALPVFAAEQLGNPHGLDYGTKESRLLLLFLSWRYGEMKTDGLNRAECRQALLMQAGILTDDLSNSCMVYGIHATTFRGASHEGILGFCRERQPVQLSLKTINGLREIRPADENCDSIYVVENPAVFSNLISRYPEQAFMCGNGQLRLASWKTLDLLDENIKIYYAGDFDPEGLLIAQRVRERYGNRVHFWKYNVDYYNEYLSERMIDAGRLNSLHRVGASELLGIKDAMLQKKRAAYQESMLAVYQLEERKGGL